MMDDVDHAELSGLFHITRNLFRDYIFHLDTDAAIIVRQSKEGATVRRPTASHPVTSGTYQDLDIRKEAYFSFFRMSRM